MSLLGGCASTREIPAHPFGGMPLPGPPPAAALAPGFQYLYGSGEATALSEQAYNALVDAVRRRLAGEAAPRPSAVLAPDATLDRPRAVPCDAKPPAVVFDVDETLLLNTGFEYDDATHPGRAYDERRWADWERTGADKVAAVPGAVAAVRQLRRMGVAVIFNTNRSAANVAFTEAALDHAGLGPARHGDTLWLKGDNGAGSGKDTRRQAIAARWCVVAMAGDQLGDFSDLFTGSAPARRAAAASPALAGLWGRAWFVLPNPVYGTGLRGSVDEVFPPAQRWSPAPR